MEVVHHIWGKELKNQTSSVSPKGQITLPIEIRKKLGIKPKDKVTFTIEDGSVRVQPLGSQLTEGFASVPALKQPRSLDDMEEIAHEEIARNAASEGL